MSIEDAVQRVGLAGRELGGGPGAAVDRILSPGARQFCDRLPSSSSRFPGAIANSIAYGVAVGLVCAEEPATMKVLEEIEEEWRSK